MILLMHVGRINPGKYYKMSRNIEVEKGRINQDDVDVDIQSHIRGYITWSVEDIETILIEVRAKSMSSAALEKIAIDFRYDRKSFLFQLSEHSPQNINDYRSGGFYHGYGVCALMVCLVVCAFTQTGKAGVVCCLIAAILMLADGSEQNYTTAEVNIRSPRNQSYRNVSVFILGGRIRVDPDLLQTGIEQLRCSTSTGSGEGCPHCCHGYGVCRENTCSCVDDRDSRFSCGKRIGVENTLFVNPSDSRLTGSRYSNGDTLLAYGIRQLDGTPKSISVLRHRRAGEATLTVRFDKEHRVGQIYSSGGDTVDLEWRSDCHVYVTALTSSHRYQTNTDVRTCKQTTEQIRRGYTKMGQNGSHYQSDIFLGLRHKRAEAKKSKFSSKDSEKGRFHWPFVHVPILVSRCGKPETSAEVYAVAETENADGGWGSTVEYHGTQSGTAGMYYIKIPNKPARRAKYILDNSCPSIGPPVMKTCSTVSSTYEEQLNKICEATEDSLRYVEGISQAEVDEIVSTCKAGFQTVVRYCKTLDLTPSTTEQECRNKFIDTEDIYTNKPLKLYPVAVFPGGHLVKGPGVVVNVSESMIFISQILELEDKRPNVEITSVKVTPNDPAPMQRYDVTTDYVCGTPTTEVDMRIVGSDGYRNSAVCNGASNCSCCVLSVAGAAELVVDDVKLSVFDPRTKYNFTRQIIVIF